MTMFVCNLKQTKWCISSYQINKLITRESLCNEYWVLRTPKQPRNTMLYEKLPNIVKVQTSKDAKRTLYGNADYRIGRTLFLNLFRRDLKQQVGTCPLFFSHGIPIFKRTNINKLNMLSIGTVLLNQSDTYINLQYST